MSKIQVFNPDNKPEQSQKTDIVNFLFTHLGKYGDPQEHIENALNYALKETPSPGGFIMVDYEGDDIGGVVVINETGMKGYIPENILVYIAVNENMRGKGIGKKLMTKSVELAEGDVALHVEPDNPAAGLYEGIGFTNKYLEMRFAKNR